MKNADLNNYKVRNDRKVHEIERLSIKREHDLLDFFKSTHTHTLEDEKKEFKEEMVDNKYLVIIDPNTEDEKLHNCFSSLKTATDSFNRLNSKNKALAKGSIIYRMVLGVIFVEKYEVEGYISSSNNNK